MPSEPRPCCTMIMCTCNEILRSLGHIPGRSRKDTRIWRTLWKFCQTHFFPIIIMITYDYYCNYNWYQYSYWLYCYCTHIITIYHDCHYYCYCYYYILLYIIIIIGIISIVLIITVLLYVLLLCCAWAWCEVFRSPRMTSHLKKGRNGTVAPWWQQKRLKLLQYFMFDTTLRLLHVQQVPLDSADSQVWSSKFRWFLHWATLFVRILHNSCPLFIQA